MNLEVKEAIADGNGREFARLLRNYGLWSHYCGIKGYFTGHTLSETYVIEDESALMIDRAFSYLKRTQPNLYELLVLYYVKQKSPDEIYLILRKRHIRILPRKTYIHRKNYFEFNPAVDTALKYVTTQAICDLIRRGEQLIIERLRKDEAIPV